MRAGRAHRKVNVIQKTEWTRMSGRRRRSIEYGRRLGGIDRRDVYGALLARMTVSCRPIVMDGEISMQTKPWETSWRRRCYKTIPMKLMFGNNVALDDVSASRIVVWTQLEWKEPSWVGIEYSDGASGLYAPCRAMRICPFKRIRYEDFDT
jgi:hypothetical protein